MAVNPADPAQNSYVLPGGQSGNPLSPNYSDQFDLWKKGGAISIGWNPEDIDQRVTECLVLERPRRPTVTASAHLKPARSAR
jgi:acyl-homoserine lactone acylase PvdQ